MKTDKEIINTILNKTKNTPQQFYLSNWLKRQFQPLYFFRKTLFTPYLRYLYLSIFVLGFSFNIFINPQSTSMDNPNETFNHTFFEYEDNFFPFY